MSPAEPGAAATPQAEAVDRGEDYALLLFVSGASPSSARAIRLVQAMCEEHLQGRYALTVIDVHHECQLAQQHRVLATPTLMRRSPPPELMRVGDFSDQGAVLVAMGIWPADA